MEKLDKYIKMCRLAIKQRFTRTDQQEKEKLDAWLNESDENRKLYDSIDQIDPTKLKDYYPQTDVEAQLSRFYRNRKRIKRSIVWRWSARGCHYSHRGNIILHDDPDRADDALSRRIITQWR